jgi:hypothetical protein
MLKRIKKHFGLFLVLCCILVFQVFKAFPEWGESYYRRGIYKSIRSFWTFLDRSAPIDADLCFLLFFGVMFFFPIRRLGLFHHGKRPFAVLRLGTLIASFYIIWGFNYACPSFFEHLKIEVSDAPVQIDTQNYLDQCEVLHKSIEPTFHYASEDLPQEEIDDLSELLVETLDQFHFFNHGKANVRQLSESGILRRLGIAGIFMPFSGAGNIDRSYTRHQKLFTCTHELAHAYGITDEGEANLLAYLALMNSPSEEHRFSAAFTHLRYLLSTGDLQEEELPLWAKDELEILRANAAMYPPFFQEISQEMNNLYLKANGLDEGVSSYLSFPQKLVYIEHFSVSGKSHNKNRVN